MGTCPSARAASLLEPVFESRCRQWRADVIERLNAEQPEVILLANYAAKYESGEDADFAAEWAEGLASTIRALPDGSRLGIVADVPDMGVSPAICLSAHLREADACAVPRRVALRADLSAAEKTTAEVAGAAYLDLTDYFCGRTSCPPVIGNLLTHRDGDHLTATFSEALKDPLWRELRPLLAE